MDFDYNMELIHLWNIFLYLLTARVVTGSTFSVNEKDIIDTIAGKPFTIRTWQLNGSSLFITVKKGNSTRLDTSLDENIDRDTTTREGRMMLTYNHTIQKVFLTFENVSKEDGGLYEMKESFNKTKAVSYDIKADAYERRDGTWDLQINVFEPDEVKQGYVGANISMEFGKSVKQSTLYNYDQLDALLVGSSCSVLTDSHLYGRLRCESNVSGKLYRITIEKVTHRDAGLYKVASGKAESGQCFFNITDIPICAVVGDNITIGWFYNQQGIKRTLRVIHPNQEVLMLLPLTNVPQINNNFQHRLQYSGEVAESFVLFMMLNVRQSDAGIYTIETLHGNVIPGSKQLIVEDSVTTITTNTSTTDTPSTKCPHYSTTNNLYGQQSIVRAGITPTSTPRTITWYTSLTESPSHYTVTDRQDCYPNSVRPGISMYVVIAVATAAVGVIMAMIRCLIWFQRKNKYSLEAVQRLVLDKLETTYIATSSTIRRPPPVPLREKESTCCPAPKSSAICNAVLGLSCASIPTASALVNNALYSTYSLSDLEDDKPSVNFTLNLNGSNERTDENILVACDAILDSCPSVCTSSIEKHTSNRIADGNGQRQVSERIQVMYAEVKKGPKFSSTHTTTGRTDGLCGDGYEMVDISRDSDPNKTLKDNSKASESTKGQTPSCHGSRNEYVHGANKADGYELAENVMNIRSAENIRSEDTMAIKDGEPKEQTKISGSTYDDYADIDL